MPVAVGDVVGHVVAGIQLGIVPAQPPVPLAGPGGDDREGSAVRTRVEHGGFPRQPVLLCRPESLAHGPRPTARVGQRVGIRSEDAVGRCPAEPGSRGDRRRVGPCRVARRTPASPARRSRGPRAPHPRPGALRPVVCASVSLRRTQGPAAGRQSAAESPDQTDPFRVRASRTRPPARRPGYPRVRARDVTWAALEGPSAASEQGDPGRHRKMVAAGGGQGADVVDARRARHDLVDPHQRQARGVAEGEAPPRPVQP